MESKKLRARAARTEGARGVKKFCGRASPRRTRGCGSALCGPPRVLDTTPESLSARIDCSRGSGSRRRSLRSVGRASREAVRRSRPDCPRIIEAPPGLLRGVDRGEIDPAIQSAKDWISGLDLPSAARRRIELHDNGEVGASIASGSYPVSAMIVIPCSAGTLGTIANGISRALLHRAADVSLKERRPLVLSFRESPYSLVHIENMRRAALAGAIIAPPSPAFYIAEPSIDRLVSVYCRRVARLLALELP